MVRVQNIGARVPVNKQPVELHFIDVKGKTRNSLHDIFPCSAEVEPPMARLVVFRQFSVEMVDEDQLLVRVRRGLIEAAIFAQRLSSNTPQHRQLITFFMATLMKQVLCECGCYEGALRTRHSQSLRERVTQLLHGFIINNGAFMAWDTTPDGSQAAELQRIKNEIKGNSVGEDIDDEILLDEDDLRNMKRFSRRFQLGPNRKKSLLQRSIPMYQWNPENVGTLKGFSDEPNTEIYQKRIEEAISDQLRDEAA
jgi:hypothetical protein